MLYEEVANARRPRGNIIFVTRILKEIWQILTLAPWTGKQLLRTGWDWEKTSRHTWSTTIVCGSRTWRPRANATKWSAATVTYSQSNRGNRDCFTCGGVCLLRKGLVSHSRKCNNLKHSLLQSGKRQTSTLSRRWTDAKMQQPKHGVAGIQWKDLVSQFHSFPFKTFNFLSLLHIMHKILMTHIYSWILRRGY